MALNPVQIDRFEEAGYLQLDGLLSQDELNPVIWEFEGVVDREARRRMRQPHNDDGLTTRNNNNNNRTGGGRWMAEAAAVVNQGRWRRMRRRDAGPTHRWDNHGIWAAWRRRPLNVESTQPCGDMYAALSPAGSKPAPTTPSTA